MIRLVPRRAVLLAAGALLLAAACSSTPAFDRDRAIGDLVDANAGRLTREQAACVVDRVVAEVGAAQLAPGATPTPQQVERLTAIKVDCVGVANLGLGPATSTTLARTGVTGPGREPQRYGDDARLDLLYTACQKGSGPACDQLFDASPLGSDYEEFASTCGGRTKELRCAERYPGSPVAPPGTGAS